MLCFQGHPEFVHDYSRALLEMRHDFLGDQVYAQGISSLDRDHHGAAVAEWMMRFVARDRAV
ncbi:amidotransferase [compost metagenome]